MARRLLPAVIALGLLAATTGPAAAGRGWIDRIEDVDTVLAVRVDTDFPIASLMRATCAWTAFVQRRNGAGIEIARCTLSDEPVMVPAFQGTPPTSTFIHRGGACEWTSDYWYARDGSTVMASSFAYVVTPSGNVYITAHYPAEPLACA